MAKTPTDYIAAGLAAAQTIAQDISGRAGLRAFRAAGGHIGNQRWFQLIAGLRAQSEQRAESLSLNLHALPSQVTPTQWTSSTKRGYFQQVDVVVKDTVTGEVRARTFTGFGRSLRTPAEVIAEALAHFEEGIGAGAYEERILGAAYTGTYSVGSAA